MILIPASQAKKLRDWLAANESTLNRLEDLGGWMQIAAGSDYLSIQIMHKSGGNELLGGQIVPSGVLFQMPVL